METNERPRDKLLRVPCPLPAVSLWLHQLALVSKPSLQWPWGHQFCVRHRAGRRVRRCGEEVRTSGGPKWCKESLTLCTLGFGFYLTFFRSSLQSWGEWGVWHRIRGSWPGDRLRGTGHKAVVTQRREGTPRVGLRRDAFRGTGDLRNWERTSQCFLTSFSCEFCDIRLQFIQWFI